MPTYAFICNKCDHHFDRLISIANRDNPLTEACPACSEAGYIVRNYGDSHIEWSDAVQLGMKKAPADWRDFLKTLKKNTRGAADNINVG